MNKKQTQTFVNNKTKIDHIIDNYRDKCSLFDLRLKTKHFFVVQVFVCSI